MLAVNHLAKVPIGVVSLSKVRDIAENYLHVAAAGLVVFVLILSAVHVISSKFAPSPGTITVQVHSGETLWTYARQYGSPDEYILKRVHKIAAINKLDAGRPLQVGQKLVIPVERPTLSAKAGASTP